MCADANVAVLPVSVGQWTPECCLRPCPTYGDDCPTPATRPTLDGTSSRSMTARAALCCHQWFVRRPAWWPAGVRVEEICPSLGRANCWRGGRVVMRELACVTLCAFSRPVEVARLDLLGTRGGCTSTLLFVPLPLCRLLRGCDPVWPWTLLVRFLARTGLKEFAWQSLLAISSCSSPGL